MAYCSNCGEEVEEGTTICPECGTQLSQTEPEEDSGEEESRNSDKVYDRDN